MFQRSFTWLTLLLFVPLSFGQTSIHLASKNDPAEETQLSDVGSAPLDDDPLADGKSGLLRRRTQFPGHESRSKLGAVPLPSSGNLLAIESSFIPPDRGLGFRWRSALKQSLVFLSLQHGYAMTQAKTRRELSGPFFEDYVRSLKGLGGWADGGRFFTNYIAHPIEGSFTGFLQIQNDPQGVTQQFGRSKAYWKSRMKAMAWAAAFSTQFELGPISQASIGNVGLHTDPLKKKKRKLAYVDLVVTPTIGTGWLIGEDLLNRYVINWLERRIENRFLTILFRCVLNPTRAGANVFRLKQPWYKDK